jgi:hypothetical protein
MFLSILVHWLLLKYPIRKISKIYNIPKKFIHKISKSNLSILLQLHKIPNIYLGYNFILIISQSTSQRNTDRYLNTSLSIKYIFLSIWCFHTEYYKIESTYLYYKGIVRYFALCTQHTKYPFLKLPRKKKTLDIDVWTQNNFKLY